MSPISIHYKIAQFFVVVVNVVGVLVTVLSVVDNKILFINYFPWNTIVNLASHVGVMFALVKGHNPGGQKCPLIFQTRHRFDVKGQQYCGRKKMYHLGGWI